MSDEESPNLNDSALNDMAASMARLQPSPSRLDRDRVLFLAGQAAGNRRSRRTAILWPAISGTLAAAALLLAMVVINDRAGREIRQVAIVDPQKTLAGKPPVAPGEGLAYLRLRTEALDDHWPTPMLDQPDDRATDTSAPDQHTMLKELLGS
jgi:hypothetical protein